MKSINGTMSDTIGGISRRLSVKVRPFKLRYIIRPKTKLLHMRFDLSREIIQQRLKNKKYDNQRS